MSEGIKELNKENFSSTIGNSNKTVLVDFWAPWCGPCRMLAPELEGVRAELGDDVVVAKVNVDSDPELAEQFGVQSIPNIIIFKQGKPIQQLIGFQNKTALINAVRGT